MKIVHRDHYITVHRHGNAWHGHFSHHYAGETPGMEDVNPEDDLSGSLGYSPACVLGPWQMDLHYKDSSFSTFTNSIRPGSRMNSFGKSMRFNQPLGARVGTQGLQVWRAVACRRD